MSGATFRLALADEAATRRLGEDLAAILKPGDLVLLSGDLGAGKSTLARSLIRAVADDETLDVPSPTFTLVQSYPLRLTLSHFDLYRIQDAGEIEELGLDEALGLGAALVEWPERGGSMLPAGALRIRLDDEGEGRVATIEAPGDWPERIARTLSVRSFLDRSGWPGAARRHLQGDASTRAYERISRPETLGAGESAVLMNAPARAPGPPLPGGGTYDEVAHRATDVRPFIAMDEAIRAAGFSAPAIFAADMSDGLLLLEDLGSEGLLKDGEPDFDRYALAVEVLAEIHAMPRARHWKLPDGTDYRIPRFDVAAFAIEADLAPRWYAPLLGVTLSSEVEAAFASIWQQLFQRLDRTEKSWLLRDYHSPNLLFLPHRHGTARIGILDHQDAMIGASAYDVASLGQDVRVTIAPGFESALKARYVARRHALGAFDEAEFAEAYAISGAQRTTKVLGGFARLAASGKPQYLRHIPRVWDYLRRNFQHPVLSDLALWYESYLPYDDKSAPSGSP
jgi:hypothetical protein